MSVGAACGSVILGPVLARRRLLSACCFQVR
jgi:hypothetical protein